MVDYNFFEKFNIDPLSFDRSGLQWTVLEKIGEDYDSLHSELQKTANNIVAELLQCPSIHSVNYRIKDREHLMEKIIRKSLANNSTPFTKENYRNLISDLIGIRVLHLYREDWTGIHQFLHSRWEFAEDPIAYIRQGDPNKLSKYYQDRECTVKEHPYGYRSVHYVLCRSTHSFICPVEIQTRTLFEEAWGEIDHSVRYPYYSENEVLGRLSGILSRLSADADDLGTYMRFLKERTMTQEEEHRLEINEKNRIIDSLRSQINALEIDSQEKQVLNDELGSLQHARKTEQSSSTDLPWLEDIFESSLFKNLHSRVEGFLKNNKHNPIPVTSDDLDRVKNAQKGLFELLKDPEKLKQLIESPFSQQSEDVTLETDE